MIAHSGQLVTRGVMPRIANELPRGEFFAGLFVLGCVSGLASRVVQSINRLGWADALFNTFEISAIVWISCAAGISLVYRDRTIGVRSREIAIGLGIVFLVALPIGPLSWFAVTALSLYIIFTTNVASSRRGAVILLAATVPMLWSRLLFQFFANVILQIDASLVGWMLGTHRAGNVVGFADGSGALVILPACSSLANVSLAFLCWATVSQLVAHKNLRLRCVVVPYGMHFSGCRECDADGDKGLSQWHYATFHSAWGDAVSNITILILIVGFSVLGVRRELFADV